MGVMNACEFLSVRFCARLPHHGDVMMGAHARAVRAALHLDRN
jgi:hypothetical protein